MTTLRDLLGEAAPRPATLLDLHRIAAAAAERRTRRVRRFAGWITGGLMLVAGTAVPVGFAVAPGSSGHDSLRVVQPSPAPDRPAPSPIATSDPRVGLQAGGPTAGTPPRAVGAVVTPTAAAAAGVRASSGLGVAGGSYPLASSCTLDSTGLAPGQSRRCQFTATASGGWAYNSDGGAGFDLPQATLVVMHAGKTTTYGSEQNHTCASAVIARGDRVRLTLTAPVTDVEPVYSAGAGRGWGCTAGN